MPKFGMFLRVLKFTNHSSTSKKGGGSCLNLHMCSSGTTLPVDRGTVRGSALLLNPHLPSERQRDKEGVRSAGQMESITAKL